MNLAFLAFFDRCRRLAPAVFVASRAKAAPALPRFRNRDLRHEPVRDDEKVALRRVPDPETGKEPEAGASAPVDDLAGHRARRAPHYRSRFVWTDRRSA